MVLKKLMLCTDDCFFRAETDDSCFWVDRMFVFFLLS